MHISGRTRIYHIHQRDWYNTLIISYFFNYRARYKKIFWIIVILFKKIYIMIFSFNAVYMTVFIEDILFFRSYLRATQVTISCEHLVKILFY